MTVDGGYHEKFLTLLRHQVGHRLNRAAQSPAGCSAHPGRRAAVDDNRLPVV